MRVALVHMRHAGTGGTERFLNHTAAHLGEKGHEVVIVCRSHEELPHPGARFEVLRPFSIGSGMRTWRFAKAVEKHVAESDYDVVFGLGRTWSQDVLRLGGGSHRTWLETGYGQGGSALAKSLGLARARHRVALRIEERALRPGVQRKVIANSEMVLRDVRERYGLPDEELLLIRNGVDLERFDRTRWTAEAAQLRSSLGIAPGALVLLFLGTGYTRKGLSTVLDAFATLPEDLAAHLIVAGYDSGAAQWEARAQVGPGGARTHFLGGRRDPEVIFAAADLYLLPTRYDPFANSTLEALASGLPVLTSDTNGGGELITPGEEGEVLPIDGGSDPWADALRSWASRGKIRSAVPKARGLAEEHSIVSKMERTTALLEEVAIAKGAGGPV